MTYGPSISFNMVYGNGYHAILAIALEKKWLTNMDEEDMASIFAYDIPSLALESYPVYTLRGCPTRPDGRHRYEPAFDGRVGLPLLGHDDPQQALF